MAIPIEQIPSHDLFFTLGALEAAIEQDDIKEAQRHIDEWGIAYEQGIAELKRRGII